MIPKCTGNKMKSVITTVENLLDQLNEENSTHTMSFRIPKKIVKRIDLWREKIPGKISRNQAMIILLNEQLSGEEVEKAHADRKNLWNSSSKSRYG